MKRAPAPKGKRVSRQDAAYSRQSGRLAAAPMPVSAPATPSQPPVYISKSKNAGLFGPKSVQ